MENMLRAGQGPQQKAGESDGSYRKRVTTWFSARWHCGESSFRAYTSPAPWRWLAPGKTPEFMADLKRFGSARFNAGGDVIAASLGKGMDAQLYLEQVERERAAWRERERGERGEAAA